MSEQSIIHNQPENETESNNTYVLITDILKEMQQLPREYWFNLLQIIKLYRESVTQTAVLEPTQETDRLMQQHRALVELSKQWIEEGDQNRTSI
jgi:hypothetical protein